MKKALLALGVLLIPAAAMAAAIDRTGDAAPQKSPHVSTVAAAPPFDARVFCFYGSSAYSVWSSICWAPGWSLVCQAAKDGFTATAYWGAEEDAVCKDATPLAN